MNKECIILAGGLGTRLQSVVSDVPKCMAPVANKPFLSHIFGYLESHKFNHIILSLGYKSEIIIDWLKTQNRNFEVSYVIESKALGTGGAIRLAFSKVRSDKAIVLNGDTFFNIDNDSLFDFHLKQNAEITLALKPMTDFDRYGSVEIDNNNRILKFKEKQHLLKGLINGGVYLINKNIFDYLELSEVFSFEKEILEAKTSELEIYGLPFENYFIDIGIPSDFEKANIDFLNNIF